MDRFLIKAKPQPYDVIPYTIVVQPSTIDILNNKYINVIGRSFLNIRNIYLSGSNNNIFPTTTTFYNPFSSNFKLSASNLGFKASKVTEFYVQNEHYITLVPSEKIKSSGYIDIIIENEAGCGVLSRDSVVPFYQAYSNQSNIQKPCVSGIKVIVFS